MIWCQNFD